MDVKRAHFYARALRRVFVRMPLEDPRWHEGGGSGELIMSLYGTQDAAANLEQEYASTLVSHHFRRGEGSPCIFWCPESQIRVFVHGDDFVAVGYRSELDKLVAKLKDKYEMKVQRLGWSRGTEKEARILGRIVRLVEQGLTIEADPALLEEVVHMLSLTQAKTVKTPAVRTEFFGAVSSHDMLKRRCGLPEGRQEHEEEPNATPQRYDKKEADADDVYKVDYGEAAENESPEEQYEGIGDEKLLLEAEEAKLYVSAAALLNYLSPDWPELQWPVEECLRKSSAPSRADMGRLKRIARYILGVPRKALLMEWCEASPVVRVFVDSDFAGCQRTRKSSAGAAVFAGPHLVKTFSKTLSVLALSSGEAELMSVVRGTAEGMGIVALYQDVGVDMRLEIHSDATAAIGMVARLGLGKVRHLAVSDLWIQQVARHGTGSYHKVGGSHNPADLCTKAVEAETLEKHLETMGYITLGGRARTAPMRRSEPEK